MKVYQIDPYVGGVVVTTEGYYGHVAYIEEVLEDGIVVSEANYGGCGVHKRFIPFGSGIIRGYR